MAPEVRYFKMFERLLAEPRARQKTSIAVHTNFSEIQKESSSFRRKKSMLELTESSLRLERARAGFFGTVILIDLKVCQDPFFRDPRKVA